MPKNHYDILGINKNATKSEIKKAYYGLAKQYHPDRTINDSEAVISEKANRFKEIELAYSVLSDEQKKGNYDLSQAGSHTTSAPQQQHQPPQQQRHQSPPQQQPQNEKQATADLLMAARARQWTRVKELTKIPGIDINATDSEGKTVFWYAATTYPVDLDLLHALAKAGANVNQKPTMGSGAGMTPLLFLSAGFGLEGWKSVETLLKVSGIDINATDSEGKTAIWYATRDGRKDMISALVNAGAHADVTPTSGPENSPLLFAARNDSWPVLKELIKSKKININATDSEGKTVFWYAATTYPVDLDLLHALAKAGANVNQKPTMGSGAGMTPLLFLSAGFGLEGWKSVETLLKVSGIDINATDSEGKTAIWYATRDGRKDMISALVNAGAHADVTPTSGPENSPLLFAARNDSWPVLKELIKSKKININATDSEGKTVFWYAATTYPVDLDLLHALAKAGANVNQKPTMGSGAGMTPLLFLSAGFGLGRWKSVEKLLKVQGIDINAANSEGKTAIWYATKDGRVDMISALVNAGAHADVTPTSGPENSPLLFAARNDSWPVLKELIKSKKININATDSEGKTVFWYAATTYPVDLDLLHALAKAGANVNQKPTMGSGAGMTPLLFLSAGFGLEGWKSVETLLKVSGIDINATDSEGKTAIWYATRDGRKDIVLVLQAKGAHQPPEEPRQPGTRRPG